MSGRILCVDDEPQVLAAFRRMLRGRFELEGTSNPEEALTYLKTRGPYAVLLTDMRMPGIDGVELLSHARRISPDTARVMLTGNADQQTAVRAVNEGSIFRFLNKPCEPEQLAATLEAAVEHSRHLRAERELVEHTLQGAVTLLIEVLALADPDAFGRATRLREQAASLARAAGCERPWEVEMAAMLLHLGGIALPPEVRRKQALGRPLLDEERRALASVPRIGAQLISHVPRLERVAELVRVAPGLADGTLVRNGTESRTMELLAVLIALDASADCGRTTAESWKELRVCGRYDALALQQVETWLNERTCSEPPATTPPLLLAFDALRPGMVTAKPIETTDGRMLLASNQTISVIAFERIRNHARLCGVREPIQILAPAPPQDSRR